MASLPTLHTFVLYLTLCVLKFCEANVTNVNFYLDEVRSLSELPLEKLIKIKSSFVKKSVDEYDVSPEGRTSSALSLPMTMPLKRIGNKPIRRYEEWDEKGKDSKISKIFQLTVTALSFLAFGGYLLTLIITAIRRNQNNNNQSNVIVLSSLQKIKRPKRNLYMYDPLEYDYDVEHLYRGMIMLSSDYSSHSIKNRF